MERQKKRGHNYLNPFPCAPKGTLSEGRVLSQANSEGFALPYFYEIKAAVLLTLHFLSVQGLKTHADPSGVGLSPLWYTLIS